MDYRTIPGTDLNISVFGFGNFVFGTNWWGDFSDEQGIELQNYAFDKGVNFFDTSPAYGNGRAENLLAQTIKYAGRDNIIVSTKCGYDFYSDPGEEGGHRERRQDFSAAFLEKDIEHSLKRLGIDCIDLYQSHNLKLDLFADEYVQTMHKFVQQGKIRYWGVAVGPAIGWREEAYKAFIEHDAAVVQTVMNMYEQDPGREFCEICDARGRGGVIARVPTNSGILDEEFKSADHQFPPQDHRKFRDKNWIVYGLKKNEIIRPLVEEYACSIREFSFKWLASQKSIVSVEPNLLSKADIDDNVAAANGKYLSEQTLAKITELYNTDFAMGDEAHPCDWKSSVTETGTIRSGYQKPQLTV